MGHFFKFNPGQYHQESAEEIQPEIKSKKAPDLTAPQEWAGCEIEHEMAGFAKRNKNTRPSD
ncbi:hypothetical protein [Desulforamulus ruminis]|uniref:Uncharacterized protein n=1 Tax=Desulforamulus ruminis (strain ATCC 23193 / DSM 2154 / NCIMB 8452 / DL) TaxID=696281 RepID=F6DKT4_DESRL|nr:hypothetical protein [Desulforamulus ruminis]AEG60459.1 hypothetical protein Desru_2210 [Desulforamulus ruminis DSM 2154]